MPTYLFSDFELDTSLFQLRRGEELIEIRPQVFDVLAYLIRHRDRLVSKNELIRQVWRATAMSESSVPTCIAAVRKALADDPASPRFIATHRGRGYQFIAEVRWRAEFVQPFPALASVAAGREGIRPLFAGRASELTALCAALERILSRAPRRVRIVGEPVVGSTRTTGEFALSVRDGSRLGEPTSLAGARPAAEASLRSTPD